MKLIILQLFFVASFANAKYLRRTQESKLFHFIPATPFVSASAGIVAENSSEGTENISQLKSGSVIQYAIEMPVEESYLLQVRVSSPTGGGKFDVANAETGEVYATFENLPASGGWQRYKHINRFVVLPAGNYNLAVNVNEPGFNLLWMYFKQQDGTLAPAAPTPAETPVTPPADVPAPTMSAAPVMTPVAQPVMTPVAQPVMAPVEFVPNEEAEKWSVMIDAVDFTGMMGVEVETSEDGNRNVAFLDPGDYLEYMVDFPTVGKYRVSMSVAAPDGEGSFTMNVGAQKGVAVVDEMPATGDWTMFETTTVQLKVETVGLQPLRIDILEPGWNLMWLYVYHDMAHDCKDGSAHECDDHASASPVVPIVSIPVIPEPTPAPTLAPTSAPTDCHNSTMHMG